jgi:pyroglutamyl-peptidase
MAASSARKQKSRIPSKPVDKRPQLLVYGFKPYDQFLTNITARAIKKLAPRAGLKKVIFPVRFSESQFVQTIRKHKRVAVLGLGQCSAGTRFRIERRAANRQRPRRAARSAPIRVGGPRWLKTTLQLKSSHEASASQDAGTYVCNFSMYVTLDHLRRQRSPTRFGFIHIPFHFSVKKVTVYLERIIDRLELEASSSAACRQHSMRTP